jgi:hypothetical protein
MQLVQTLRISGKILIYAKDDYYENPIKLII